MRLTLAVAAAVVVTLLLAFGAMDAVELPVRDLAMRTASSAPATATAIVAIDEPSLRSIGPWPWPLDVRVVRQTSAARFPSRSTIA